MSYLPQSVWYGMFLAVLLVVCGTVPRVQSDEAAGWKPHRIRQGDGQGGWIVKSAQCQPLKQSFWGPSEGSWAAFGLAQMDNGEIVLVGTSKPEGGGEDTVIAFSSDRGESWSEFESIPGVTGRPMMLAYLGKGVLTFRVGQRYFSADYGRTWSEHVPVPLTSEGHPFSPEGNPVVDRDAQGIATAIGEIGWHYGPSGASGYPDEACGAVFRWSYDGGYTWVDEVEPAQWYWTDTYNGKSFARGVSEGAVTRAQNGWLVAALRTDMPARYLDQPHDDSLEGTGISISKDNGKTWSPIKLLFDAGRHHAHLLTMPNGDIVMTLTVRDDVRNGKLATYRRGCDAVVSHDNGLTWDLARSYVLDQYEYYDGNKWYNGECGHLYSTLLDDGSILTTQGNYKVAGMSLIRWRP